MAKKNVNVFVDTNFNECYAAKFMVNKNNKTISCTITEYTPFDLETLSDIDAIFAGFDTSKLDIAVSHPKDIIETNGYSKIVEYTGVATCDPRDKFDAEVGCIIAFKQAIRKRHNAAMQNIQDYIDTLDNVKNKLLAYKKERKADFQLLMQTDLGVHVPE